MMVMGCKGVLGILLAAVVLGCSDSAPEQPVETTVIDPSTAGRISARVTYGGEVPPPKAIVMSSAPQCALAHGEPVYERSLVVNDGRVENAIVYIEKGLESYSFAAPDSAVIIDQKGCLYEPHVAVAMVGQPVEFLNSDAEAHNVHGFPNVLSAWNFILSRKGAKRTMTFDRPEMGVRIGCDIHPWMRGYLGITVHPYAAVTSADGSADLGDVPPGTYTVAVWHERLGTQAREVTLEPRGRVDIELSYQE